VAEGATAERAVLGLAALGNMFVELYADSANLSVEAAPQEAETLRCGGEPPGWRSLALIAASNRSADPARGPGNPSADGVPAPEVVGMAAGAKTGGLGDRRR